MAITRRLPSIWFCLLMDLVGLLTYVIPWWGEFGDVFWAPVSGLIFFFTFGGRTGAIGGMLNFIEEILPFADFIPTYTIAWFYTRNQLRHELPQLG